MKLENQSTLSVAIAYLTEKTSRAWTEEFLLQVAKSGFPSLLAEPDKPAPVITRLYDSDSSHTPVWSHETPWGMAILGSLEIEDLRTRGMTYAQYAVGNNDLIFEKLPEEHNPLDLGEMEYRQRCQFSPKALIRTDMVRVPAELIKNILSGKNVWPIDLQAVADMPVSETVLIKSRTPVTLAHKQNRNSLDTAIEKAISQAGSLELADVYMKLKELALNNELSPFTGDFKGSDLLYTDDNNTVKQFTKNALGKRLKRRKDSR